MLHSSSTARLLEHLHREASALRPGERLPSTRRLVAEYGVSPVTVSRAIAALTAEGVVVTRPGAGTFIAEPPGAQEPVDYSWQTVALGDRSIDVSGLSPLSDPPNSDELISLATGYLHTTLMPLRALTAAWTRAARIPDVWARSPATGLHSLRSWFAQSAGAGTDARDVVVTSGGQSAITATFRALVPAGAPLLMESPTYPGAISVARAAQIRPVPVPTDRDGVIPELLAEAFARTDAQAFYCQPTYTNPTGSTLLATRREAILEACAAAGAFVIEDDFARWLSHGPRPPAPLLSDDRDGRVVYITSLTKVTSPSLRIGAVIARGPVADRLRAMRVVDDMFVPRPTQEAVLDLVSRAAWGQHLRRLSGELEHRCRVLTRAVTACLPSVTLTARPSGGMHLWVRLPDGLDDLDVTQAARQGGVIVMPGRPFFPADAPGPHLRLTFSAAAGESELVTGVRRLAAAVPDLT